MYPIESVIAAMNYIDMHYQDAINSKSVAQTVGYSEYHFHRSFAYITGMSIADYLRCRRLHAAASRLTETTETILSIALSVGFTNQQTFDRTFKKKYGMTPKAFRTLCPQVKNITSMDIINRFYYRSIRGNQTMLKPYIVKKGVRRFVGQSAKIGGTKPTNEDISHLFENMHAIFEKISHPVDEKFYGITVNFANGTDSSRKEYWLCKEVATFWRNSENGEWEALGEDMETLVIPATRWLYIPVRYDDPFVMSLAPEEFRHDSGYLTPCVYDWAKLWLTQNGYQRQDYPFELEIYGLHDGYEGFEDGANITLAIPII